MSVLLLQAKDSQMTSRVLKTSSSHPLLFSVQESFSLYTAIYEVSQGKHGMSQLGKVIESKQTINWK